MPRARFAHLPLAAGGAGLLALALACSTDSPTAPRQQPGDPVDLPDPGVSAAFVFSQSSQDPLTFTFTNESAGATTYQWTFGDGRRSSEANPIHTYAEPGTYRVSLTASNATFFDVDEQFLEAGVLDVVPVDAAFAFEANDLTVIFTDGSSGDPSSYKWDFGDGTISRERDPVHAYGRAGTYVVTLLARDGISSDEASAFVTVSPDTGLDAAFTFEAAGLTVIFTNASTGDPTRFEWDFGDGATSSDRDPVHTYAAAGTYVVTLTIRDDDGSDSVSDFVTVPPPEEGT